MKQGGTDDIQLALDINQAVRAARGSYTAPLGCTVGQKFDVIITRNKKNGKLVQMRPSRNDKSLPTVFVQGAYTIPNIGSGIMNVLIPDGTSANEIVEGAIVSLTVQDGEGPRYLVSAE
jgi:hypothetical protein